MTLSCFSSSSYNLAVVPSSRTNCSNQILVCTPTAMAKLFQSVCRKVSVLLPFPRRRRGTSAWPVTSAQLGGMCTACGRGGACWCNSVLILWWHPLFRKCRYMELHLFGYLFPIKIRLQFSGICSFGTIISAANKVCWEINLDYRHDWLRFLF